MAEKQHTSILAPIFQWLGGVTEKNLAKGGGIVVLTGLFAASTAYAMASKIEIPELSGMSSAIGGATAIGAFIGTLLAWIITTLIYHAAAHLLGGKGNMNRMFALTAYASLPTLVQQFLRFVNYWFLGGIPLQTITFAEMLISYFNVFSIIGLVLIGVAIMVNYGLSVRRAIVVALIPTTLSLAFGLYSLRMASVATQTNTGGLFGFRRPS